jgi:hypothetical protein
MESNERKIVKDLFEKGVKGGKYYIARSFIIYTLHQMGRMSWVGQVI